MFKNLGALGEKDKKGGFVPYMKGLYILTVVEVTKGEIERKEFTGGGVPIGTGEMMPQVTIKFDVSLKDGGGVMDINGDEANFTGYVVWVNEENLGWNKKTNQPKQGRMIVSALLGVSSDGDLTPAFESDEALLGRQMEVFLGVEKNKKGEDKNVILSADAVKKK